jgi:hypothetical protein
LNRTGNPLIALILRSPLHPLVSRRLALITVTGRRSGRTYTFPLGYEQDGDTVTVGPGAFAGGVTITKSINLVGVAAAASIISGGGPVVTIGEFGASSEPTVSIDGFTITGGVTRSSPESVPFTGHEGVFAAGGGVEIPPDADFGAATKVTISNSVITDNRVAPTETVGPTPDQVPFWPVCPSGPCPFAGAFGGGIDSWGTLTLANTTVSNNRVGTAAGLSNVASDAQSGGIQSWLGQLTITNSVVSGNRASVTAPNGRFADSGGIFAEGGSLAMSNSSVTDNSATLAAAFPDSVDMLAIAGGVHLSDQVSAATISNSTVSRNAASMTNTVGYATAFSGGVHVDIGVDFKLNNSVVSDNSISSATLAGSSSDAEGDSGAGELLGRISNTRITGNSVTVSSAAGDATALAGAIIDFGSITNSVLSDNHIEVSSPGGTVFAAGGALVVDEPGVTLHNTPVNGNTIHAVGASGSAQGGGIFDAPVPDGPPGGPLALVNSDLTGNVLSGSFGITLQGGGLYIQNKPFTSTNSSIAGNSPDQCFGC